MAGAKGFQRHLLSPVWPGPASVGEEGDPHYPFMSSFNQEK